MTDVIYLLNSASVGIFGMILSASFCDIVWTKTYQSCGKYVNDSADSGNHLSADKL